MLTRSGPFQLLQKIQQFLLRNRNVNSHKLKSLPHDEKLRLYLHYSKIMFGCMRLSNQYMRKGDFDTSFRIMRRSDRVIHKRLNRLWGVLTLGERREFDEVLSQLLKHKE